MRAIIHPERLMFGDETVEHPGLARSRSASHGNGQTVIARLTDEEVYLVGSERDFRDGDGQQMYIRASANRGSRLRRRGATRPALSAAYQRCEA